MAETYFRIWLALHKGLRGNIYLTKTACRLIRMVLSRYHDIPLDRQPSYVVKYP